MVVQKQWIEQRTKNKNDFSVKYSYVAVAKYLALRLNDSIIMYLIPISIASSSKLDFFSVTGKVIHRWMDRFLVCLFIPISTYTYYERYISDDMQNI